MLFGNAAKFAIIAEIEDLAENGYPNGRLSLFVESKKFGDWEVIESIGTMVAGVKDILDGANIVPPSIFDLPKEEIVRLLRNSCFDESDEDPKKNYFNTVPHAGLFLILTGLCAAFDREFLVLIENEARGRFIWLNEKKSVEEALINKQDYINPVREFCEWWAKNSPVDMMY